jgi:hypothetical protein
MAGRPPSGPGVLSVSGRLDELPPGHHPGQVGLRDRVAERGAHDVPQRRHRELLRCQREPDVGVGQLRPQPVDRGVDEVGVVEGRRRQLRDGMPPRVGRQRGRRGGRDDPEVRRSQHPAAGVAADVAVGGELLEMGDLTHVHLLGEVPQDRGPQPLVGRDAATREGPPAIVWGHRPPPHQHRQHAVAHREHDRDDLVRVRRPARPVGCGCAGHPWMLRSWQVIAS